MVNGLNQEIIPITIYLDVEQRNTVHKIFQIQCIMGNNMIYEIVKIQK